MGFHIEICYECGTPNADNNLHMKYYKDPENDEEEIDEKLYCTDEKQCKKNIIQYKITKENLQNRIDNFYSNYDTCRYVNRSIFGFIPFSVLHGVVVKKKKMPDIPIWEEFFDKIDFVLDNIDEKGEDDKDIKEALEFYIKYTR